MGAAEYILSPASGKLECELKISGSKSISNRLLIIRALAGKDFPIKNISPSKDTFLLREALRMINTCSGSRIGMIVDTQDAGTMMRFLTAYLACTEGTWLLTGSPRMQERPVQELVENLWKLGAEIRYTGKLGFPPLVISGRKLQSSPVEFSGKVSSQYISALMMIAPLIQGGLDIRFREKPVSFSYLRMTAAIMKEFGVICNVTEKHVAIPEGVYHPVPVEVEPDWSSAAFWYEMAAIHGEASINLPGFRQESVQGDSVGVEIFRKLGVETEFNEQGIRLYNSGKVERSIEYDFSACPDLVPAVLAGCSAMEVTARLTGVSHLRFKESDRLEALKAELGKTGAAITLGEDYITLQPGKRKGTGLLNFKTYGDHRLVMSLAPLAMKYGTISLEDPGAVDKSYPDFWKHIQQPGGLTVDKK